MRPPHYDSCHARIWEWPAVPGDIEILTDLILGSLAVLTAGSCCWDKDTGRKYPAITVVIGHASKGGPEWILVNHDGDVSLTTEFESLSEGKGETPVERMAYDMCILMFRRPSLLTTARIGWLFSLLTTT